MSKSNWKQSSGWSAINDPTGSLEGRVLQATAGVSAINEDYLLQIVGSSVDFTDVNYSVQMDYAFYLASDATNLKFGLQARADNFSGSPELAQNSYMGLLDFGTLTAQIVKRYGGSETILATAGISSAFSYGIGVKQSMQFTCTGTTSIALNLTVNQQSILSIGDNETTKISSGYPGIYTSSGTVYIDNFQVAKYTSDGLKPADWLPSNANNLAVWLKGDTGVTATGTSVTTWADQSGNSNDAIIAAGAASPSTVANAINNYTAIQFDGADDYMAIADAATIDCNSTGVSMFFVANVATGITTGQFLASKGGASYAFGAINTAAGTTNGGVFNNSSSYYSTKDGLSPNNYQILGVVGGTMAGLNDYFWMDGTSYGASNRVSADNSDPLYLGNFNNASNFFNGSIAEVIIFNSVISDGDRQKVEGYLAQKYGIWPRLPASHPYKYLTPTV